MENMPIHPTAEQWAIALERQIAEYDAAIEGDEQELQEFARRCKAGVDPSQLKARAATLWNIQAELENAKRIRRELDIDKLRQLRELCRQVQCDPDKATKVLPPTQGFFFGSYDVDDGYLQDLADTIAAIDRVERFYQNGEDTVTLFYRASW